VALLRDVASTTVEEYRLKNNALSFPNQSNPDWDRVAAGMAAPTMDIAQARRLEVGRPVKITGSARPGPAGPLTAPLSGKPCVWYRCYVMYVGGGIGPHPLPPEGGFSDIMLVAQPAGGLFARRDNGDEISDRPFLVEDADGATVTIDPRVADINSDLLTRNRVISSRFGFVRALLVEWIVAEGAHVVVLGTVGPGGDLDASSTAFQFVSTRTERHIVDRARHGLGTHDSSAAIFRFVAGGTRLNRGIRKWTRILAVVLTLALIIAVLLALVL
jgi:hypothetical protein